MKRILLSPVYLLNTFFFSYVTKENEEWEISNKQSSVPVGMKLAQASMGK